MKTVQNDKHSIACFLNTFESHYKEGDSYYFLLFRRRTDYYNGIGTHLFKFSKIKGIQYLKCILKAYYYVS